ncbi:hypothetical protein, partial [Paenibacillus sp. AR247]|uniref:hypothetical protein n=1 Tax=Paenibacillus sp. AR247 TaxID=1631599 RepID=UPI001C61157E
QYGCINRSKHRAILQRVAFLRDHVPPTIIKLHERYLIPKGVSYESTAYVKKRKCTLQAAPL